MKCEYLFLRRETAGGRKKEGERPELILVVPFVYSPHATKPDQLLLTKGDNNEVDDIVLYNGAQWLKRENVVGKVRG